MIGLYGRHYSSRYKTIADLIPAGSEVLDMCCGPAVLYHRYLRHKSVKYIGLDINPGFVNGLKCRGIDGRLFDLRDDSPIPKADYVVMQASLYHFLPNPIPIINRMMAVARNRVIISEPIRNLTHSASPLIASIAKRFTNPGSGTQPRRFTEESLDEVFSCFLGYHVESRRIDGGREKIYVIDLAA
jgi:hypothetical protein